jgi:hypothetical protein
MMRRRHIHPTVLWLLVWGLAACGARASKNAAGPGKPECPTPPPLPLCPAADPAVTHDLDALLALESFSGAAVVEGHLHVSPMVTCTEEACPSVDPCCNSCGAPLVLTPTAAEPSYEDESGYLTLYPAASGASYSCGGSDCGLCCNVETGGIRVRASGRADMYDTKSMSLESLCAVP